MVELTRDTLLSWVIVSLCTFNITCSTLSLLGARNRKSSSILMTIVVPILFSIYALVISMVALGLYGHHVRLLIFSLIPICFIGVTIYFTIAAYLNIALSLITRVFCLALPTLTGIAFFISSLTQSEQILLSFVDSYVKRHFLENAEPPLHLLVSFAVLIVQQGVFYTLALFAAVRAHRQAQNVQGSQTLVLVLIAAGPIVLFIFDTAIFAFDIGIPNYLLAVATLPLYGMIIMKNSMLDRNYQRQIEHQREEMKRYLPDELVRQLLSHDTAQQLQGKRGVGTVMFCDIRGFTTMAETMDPLQVTTILNDYFTAMNKIIFKHGGTLNKYIGDAIMAVFGHMDQEEYVSDVSISCAFEMFARLRELNKAWVAQGRPEIHIGIGIHRGQMIYGNIGSAERLEYTVIGDTVNTAARIAQLNAKLGKPLLFSSEVLETIASEVAGIELLGDFDLKGKNKKVRLFGLETSQKVKIKLAV